MNCAYDKEKLTGYYDGELSAAEKADVERHIAACSECLRELGELKSAALLVRELPRLRAPLSIAEGVSLEIQAAGKVHVLASFRRKILWASAAAAGLFLLVNVMYFTAAKQRAPLASSAPLSPAIARIPEAQKAAPEFAEKGDPAALRMEADRSLADEGLKRRAMEESRKDLAGSDGKRAGDKPGAAAPKADALNELERSKLAGAGKELPARPAEAPAAPPAAPVPAATAKPAAEPAPPKMEAPKPEPAKDAVVEKAAAKKESEPLAKSNADLKAKVASAVVPAELPPLNCTISSLQLSKSRKTLEDSLKKMGVAAQQPPQPMKAPRNRDSENTLVLEVTDSQLAKLREELEKPGDARLMVTEPSDMFMSQYKSGGIFGRKEPVAAPVARSAGAAPKDKDAKDGEDAAKNQAEAGAVPEAKRKVTLRMVEVKTLPRDPEELQRK
ncbi:MAG TPA: anti-sigma factor [Planctomycetota bacterium]|nr:anti-sigma factor [Planctomycetota bacterium]